MQGRSEASQLPADLDGDAVAERLRFFHAVGRHHHGLLSSAALDHLLRSKDLFLKTKTRKYDGKTWTKTVEKPRKPWKIDVKTGENVKKRPF